MPCIHRNQLSARNVQYSQPDCYEHGFFVFFRYQLVYLLQSLFRAETGKDTVLDHDFYHHHKQCCRNSFSGDIRDHDAEMVLIDQEEIIKVAADFFGRLHACVNIKLSSVRERREDTWKHIHLDTAGEFQFRIKALLLRRDFHEFPCFLFQTAIHFFDGMRQCLNFVAGMDIRNKDLFTVQFANQLVSSCFQCNDRLDQCSFKDTVVNPNSDAGNQDDRNGQHDEHVHHRFPYGSNRDINTDECGELILHRVKGNQGGCQFFPVEFSQSAVQRLFRFRPFGQDLHHDLFFSGTVRPVFQESRLTGGQLFLPLREILIDLADINQIVLRRDNQIKSPELLLVNARCHESVTDIIIILILCLCLHELCRRNSADIVRNQVRIGIHKVCVNPGVPCIKQSACHQADAQDQENTQKGKAEDISAGNRASFGFDLLIVFHKPFLTLFRGHVRFLNFTSAETGTLPPGRRPCKRLFLP